VTGLATKSPWAISVSRLRRICRCLDRSYCGVRHLRSFGKLCYPGPGNTGDLTEYCTGTYGGGSVAYSDMVDGTNLATAYAYVYNAVGRLIATLSISQ
jgi:hypothetical protein